jgi:hypothetical protein
MQALALGKGYRVLVENVPFEDEMKRINLAIESFRSLF